jgi:hypothetical protein
MSQSLEASKLIAVIEMSQSKWLVAAIVPGLNRQPLKKLEAGACLFRQRRLIGLYATRARKEWGRRSPLSDRAIPSAAGVGSGRTRRRKRTGQNLPAKKSRAL